MSQETLNFCKQNFSHDHYFINTGRDAKLLDESGAFQFGIVCAYCGQVRTIDGHYNIKIIKESG